MTAMAIGPTFPDVMPRPRIRRREPSSPTHSVIVVPSEEPSSSAPQRLPDWVAQVVPRLVELSKLPPGWDSRKAAPIERGAIARALEIMAEVMEWHGPVPAIIPTVEGGVLLEWHRVGLEMEIEVEPTGDTCVMFQAVDGSRAWDGAWESHRSTAHEVVQAMATALAQDS
jgi:hypothetical protein